MKNQDENELNEDGLKELRESINTAIHEFNIGLGMSVDEVRQILKLRRESRKNKT